MMFEARDGQLIDVSEACYDHEVHRVIALVIQKFIAGEIDEDEALETLDEVLERVTSWLVGEDAREGWRELLSAVMLMVEDWS